MTKEKIVEKTTRDVIHHSGQEFLQSTRLFKRTNKKYVPKTKSSGKQVSMTRMDIVPEEKKWSSQDEGKHSQDIARALRQMGYSLQDPRKSRGKTLCFFSCIYCTEKYNLWNQHEPYCSVYNKPCHLCGENRQGYHPSQGDNYHECFYTKEILDLLKPIKKEK